MPGQERLKNDILSNDLCSACGLCVGLCPYIKTRRDRVRVIYPCGLDQGTCYSVCPKTGLDLGEMDRRVFGREREDQALGVLQGIYFARATAGSKAPGAQYGGVTSALAALALQQGLISGAILTGGEADNPHPALARTAEEVYACAGSKYVGVPTLAELNRALRDGLTGLGVVGRPCQVAAVRNMQQGNLPGAQFNASAVELVLGLFCVASLTPDFYNFLAEQVKGEKIIKMDIPEDGPVVETSAGNYRWSMDDLRPYVHKACNLCLDLTSEWADISVGATEYDKAWNTLVVRSDQGRGLLDLALEKGVIEIKEYPPQRLPVLRRAALNKKMRVLTGKGYQGGLPGCPVVPEEYRRQIEVQWGGVSQ